MLCARPSIRILCAHVFESPVYLGRFHQQRESVPATSVAVSDRSGHRLDELRREACRPLICDSVISATT